MRLNHQYFCCHVQKYHIETRNPESHSLNIVELEILCYYIDDFIDNKPYTEKAMHYQYIPYLWLLGISFAILVFLAFFSLRFRKVTGAKTFGICMIIFAFWTFCNALEMAGTDLPTKLFWANMQYFSYTTIHIFWLYMVLQFTGAKKWANPKRILPLFIIPAIFIVLVWTDQYHGLIRYGFSLDYFGSFPVIKKSYGPLYWIHPIYGYSIELISIILIARAAIHYKSIYRRQAIALLVSPIISIVPSILYVFKLSPIKNYDITPVFLGVSGIVAAVGLFRYQLFAIAPVAREVAVDNMNIGMIVIDKNGVVADVNQCAKQQLGKEEKALIGVKAEDAVSLLKIDLEDLQNGGQKEYKVFSPVPKEERYYEVQLLPVFSKRNIQSGNVLLIRDVTDVRSAQNFILDQSVQLAASNEREKLVRDLHDNLGQILGFINLQAQGIRNELNNAETEKIYQDLTKLVDVTQQAHKEIREYIHAVRTPLDPGKDFIASIEENIDSFVEQTGMAASVDIPEAPAWNELDRVRKQNILNILKGALNNIRKHAGYVEHVKISFHSQDEALYAVIEDDGDGFDTNHVGMSSFGMKIMRERAAEIGATIEIQSQLGTGTRIQLSVPMSMGDV